MTEIAERADAAAAAASGEGNASFRVEQHGFDHIPEGDRRMTLRDLGAFWIGTNLYFFNFTIGVIAFGFGLPLWQTLLAVLIGNLCYLLVGLGSIAGARSGVPTLTITRAAYGPEANRFNCLFSWVLGMCFEAVNVVFGVLGVLALLAFLGWDDPGTAGKIIGLVVVYAISVIISILGHATVVVFQRAFAVMLGVTMVVVAAFTIEDMSFTGRAGEPLAGGAAAAAWMLAIGIVAGAGLAYMQIPSDYSRYLPSRTRPSRIFFTVVASAGGAALFLSLLGASLASGADLAADPVGGLEALLPDPLYLIFLLAVIGGSIGNCIITLYSAAFAVQSLGIPLRRYQASILDGCIACLLIVYVLFINEDFVSTINDFIAIVVIWIAPFGAIWVTDSVLRRHYYDASELHAGRGGRYWGVGGGNLRGVAAFLVGAVAAALTMNAPVFQGPLSEALFSGGDMAWLFGPLAGAAVYAALTVPQIRRVTQAVPVPEAPR
jgi:NCS1 family nucleobase:cation symporter-1